MIIDTIVFTPPKVLQGNAAIIAAPGNADSADID